LADASWRDFDRRRSYEWKINFGLWAALGSLAGFLFNKGVQLSAWQLGFLIVGLIVIGLVYWLKWSTRVWLNNNLDQAAAHFYWGEADKLLGTSAPRSRRSQFIGDRDDFLNDFIVWRWLQGCVDWIPTRFVSQATRQRFKTSFAILFTSSNGTQIIVTWLLIVIAIAAALR
jgi:hypothetical protein